VRVLPQRISVFPKCPTGKVQGFTARRACVAARPAFARGMLRPRQRGGCVDEEVRGHGVHVVEKRALVCGEEYTAGSRRAQISVALPARLMVDYAHVRRRSMVVCVARAVGGQRH